MTTRPGPAASPRPAPVLPPDLANLVSRGATLLAPPTAGELGRAARDALDLCRDALAHPVGTERLRALARGGSRVTIIVSDQTRDEPRGAMIQALLEELTDVPRSQITLMIASGTHAPRPAATVLEARLISDHPVVVHDGLDVESMVELGTTSRGTRVRVHRAVATADVVITTGRIRPHYFAGYSGGAKGIFPGCAHSADARQNHLWKADPSARLGKLDDNLCRLDMEEAAALVPGAAFLLNVVADCDGAFVAAFAGHLVAAHRAACAGATPFFLVRGPRSRAIVTSDVPPVTDSLYQASKLLPPAGALLDPGGVAIVLAPCPEGIGPLETVNRGIYELGVRHHLPAGHVVRLVSSMSDEVARTSYAKPAPTIDAALSDAGFTGDGPLHGVTVLWRAGELIPS